MCGRFVLTTSAKDLHAAFLATFNDELQPRWNIAPTQQILAVRLKADGQREAVSMRWGLVPGWSKDPSAGPPLINARAETVAVKPAFRFAFKQHRCLIPASGFYEWRKAGSVKVPHLITVTGGVFAFAGLWEHWHRDDQRIESATIITTTPNELMASIHDRMPVILPAEHHALWLSQDLPPEALTDLLVPFPADQMQAQVVSNAIGNVRFQSDPRSAAR